MGQLLRDARLTGNWRAEHTVSVGDGSEGLHAPSSNAAKGRIGARHSRRQEHHGRDGHQRPHSGFFAGHTQRVCLRWKVEQFDREARQLTVIEGCQCCKARSLRNHIACAVLVRIRLAEISGQTCRTLYQVRHQMLDEFLR